ncbi:hypothetical protein ACTVZO_41720 [Streptomyces sp. IBSNAI002]|uniref:hypothetical protein n=1 Tax=Streptomyces sp. IBSNAI002 TaxID=3457500 RepID=UPI003FD34E46
MDVESVAVELSELKPSEFTAARDEYVAKARKAGDRPLAAAIAALRKPTVAAWTAGLLARRRPKEAHGLVQLGEALRTAHRTLDAGQLRKLSHDQHVVIAELARTARALAVEAGQAVSEPVLHEVEQILHAVLADADVAAQWEAGRLAKAPDVVSGFTGLEPLPGAAPPPPPPPPPPPRRPPEPSTAESTAEHVRPPAREGDKGVARARRERVKAARMELAEAQAEAARLEAAQTAAQELMDRADGAVAAAEEDVQAAKERLGTARAASTSAVVGLREAGRAAEKARARAEAAARKVEKLTGP